MSIIGMGMDCNKSKVVEIAMHYTDGLPHITQVRKRSASDDALFGEIRDVMTRHGALDRFCVTLLHVHFPVKSDEVIFERTLSPHAVEMHPVRTKDAKDAIPVSWRLGEGGKPIVGAVASRSDVDAKPLCDDDEGFLIDLRKTLEKHGAENRFGIRLGYSGLAVGADEICMESTFDDERLQRLDVIKQDDEGGVVETVWCLNKKDAPTAYCICPEIPDHFHKKIYNNK